MRLKETNGIKGIRSNLSKIFLLDYQNNVLAEAQNIMELKGKMDTPQTLRALQAVNLKPHEAKIIWFADNDIILIDLDPNFEDLVLLKNLTGDLIAIAPLYQFNSILKKTKEVQRQLLQTSSSPYNS